LSQKILIIDDERGVVLLLKTILEKKGYTVYTAQNVREGAKKLLEDRPHLVITDEVMPEIKGSELVKILKESDDTKHIPIIMISGRGEMVFSEKEQKFKWEPHNPMVKLRGDMPDGRSRETMLAAYKVDEFISKPFKTEIVEQIIADVLARNQGHVI